MYDGRVVVLSLNENSSIKGRHQYQSRKLLQSTTKKIGMNKSKLISNLVSTSCSLDRDEERNVVEERKYQGMINSLLYLTTSRFDIIFVVSLCPYFQENPKESYIIAIKCFMRYLTCTPLMGLWYPKGTNYNLFGYFDLISLVINWIGKVSALRAIFL